MLLILTAVFIISASELTAAKMELNYSLPIPTPCRPIRLSNGSTIPTIPKLMAVPIMNRCQRDGIPGEQRVCRIPDCLSGPCQHGWCEETMEGYQCHCPEGFTGKDCSEEATTMSVKTVTMSTEAATMSTEAVTMSNEATMMSTKEATMSTEATAMSIEAIMMSTGTATMSTEATTMSTEAATMSTEAATMSNEGIAMSTEAITLSPELASISTQATTMQTKATLMPQEAATMMPQDAATMSTETVTSTEAVTLLTEATTMSTEAAKMSTEATTMLAEVTTSGISASCPTDWFFYGTKCYKMFGSSDWHTAKDQCSNMNVDLEGDAGSRQASLLMTESREENEVIAAEFLTGIADIWLNCNDIDIEDTWICETDSAGTTTNHRNWGSGEPNNASGREDCAAISKFLQSKWFDYVCNGVTPGTVCQITL